MNKLISLSSEGKFSIIDSVVEKVSASKTLKNPESYEVIPTKEPTQKTSEFEVIEEDLNEEEVLEEIKEVEIADEVKPEDAEKDKYTVSLKIKPMNPCMDKAVTMNAICHSWFIVKDKGVAINWRKPLLQKTQMMSKIMVQQHPFSEGAMRYAFMMKDYDQHGSFVVKVPKNINPKSYQLEEMKNDIEAQLICSHIVNEFNEKLICSIDSKYLIEFVYTYIYEIIDKNVLFKYIYGENFIQGKYEKYNNNAGWTNVGGQDSNQTLIAQTLSHFSWQLT